MSLPKLPPKLTGNTKLTDYFNQLRECVARVMPQPGGAPKSITTNGTTTRPVKGKGGGRGGSSKPPRWA